MRTRIINTKEMAEFTDRIVSDWREWYASGRVEPEDIEEVIRVLFDCNTRIVEEDGNTFVSVEFRDPDIDRLLKKIDHHKGAPMYLSEKDIEAIHKLAR